MVAATNGHVIALDNLSGLSAVWSDALCSLATGAGFGTRPLYSDDEERLFDGARPIMLNGIEDIATRPDLLDRAVSIMLPTIDPSWRREEANLLEEFDAACPGILGALLDAVSVGVKNLPEVKLDRLPRMADFARWRTAAANGDKVRIVMLDVEDKRPVEDILWTDEDYDTVHQRAGLVPIHIYRPLANETEPYSWVSETTIAVLPENPVRRVSRSKSRGLAVPHCVLRPRKRQFLGGLGAEIRSTRVPGAVSLCATWNAKPLLRRRGDSDDAIRRFAEPRSPFLLMDTRLDVVPERYDPAIGARGTRDNTRSSSLEFGVRGLR